jgi:hypothetical protein
MKKIFGIALLLAVVATLAFGSVALAADPTEVNMNWSGSGSVGTTVTAGNDAIIHFAASGSGISGNFTAKDFNDNPYFYNVDTVSSYIQSAVADGSSWYRVNRTDSKVSMYGPPGQISYSFIGANGGTAEMATGGFTNYAELEDPTYGKPKTTSGKNFEANASSYLIYRYIQTSDGDNAWFQAQGSGTALIDCMSCNAWGSWFDFGRGSGCYTNADAQFTGAGSFQVMGSAGNSVSFPGLGLTATGDGTPGSASLQLIANWVSSFNIADYSMSGN